MSKVAEAPGEQKTCGKESPCRRRGDGGRCASARNRCEIIKPRDDPERFISVGHVTTTLRPVRPGCPDATPLIFDVSMPGVPVLRQPVRSLLIHHRSLVPWPREDRCQVWPSAEGHGRKILGPAECPRPAS